MKTAISDFLLALLMAVVPVLLITIILIIFITDVFAIGYIRDRRTNSGTHKELVIGGRRVATAYRRRSGGYLIIPRDFDSPRDSKSSYEDGYDDAIDEVEDEDE